MVKENEDKMSIPDSKDASDQQLEGILANM